VTFHSALYRGHLSHARFDALARRAFRYPVYMAALDLDELPALDRGLRLFSHERTNLYTFRDRDYAATLSPSVTGPHASLTADLHALCAANGLPAPHATRLVTNLRVAGYLFNPVSFFLNYDATGALTTVVAEVNNTYGGRFRYVLGPRDRIEPPPASRATCFRHVRELFVSPFLHGPATYDFRFDAPRDGAAIAIAMTVQDDRSSRRVFAARFAGRRSALTDRTLALAAVRYPFMTAQVIGLIHWQALKLRLAGVPYHRPERDHRPRVDAVAPRGHFE
jgi:DUF1365 family protein